MQKYNRYSSHYNIRLYVPHREYECLLASIGNGAVIVGIASIISSIINNSVDVIGWGDSHERYTGHAGYQC